jgi:hypothetical protein
MYEHDGFGYVAVAASGAVAAIKVKSRRDRVGAALRRVSSPGASLQNKQGATVQSLGD